MGLTSNGLGCRVTETALVNRISAQLTRSPGDRAPRYQRSDNAPEFVSTAILRWLVEANIDTVHIDVGKPWHNGSN